MTTISSTGRSHSSVAAHPELADLGKRPIAAAIWATTRIALGVVFFWAFIDKLFGLGFATPGERSWLNGGSPTAGYLAGVDGPFAGVFNTLSGQAAADWLFMAGLLGIGAALLLGVAMRIAAASGALLLAFMYLASLPLENNPVIDDHLVYAVVLLGLAAVRAGDTAGLGRMWRRLPVVQRYGWLQ
jgi:thiosulfate dehydrogenase [quinone] large subunit